MPTEQVNVLVDSVAVEQLNRVVDACREAGLQVDHVLAAVGVIVGSVEAAQLDRLRSVEGVAAVETNRTARVPPPESDLQ